MLKALEFIDDPEWYKPEKMQALFDWSTSPEVEASGEGRRQLGYHDGYHGEAASSQNSDYLRGYAQGKAMRSVQ